MSKLLAATIQAKSSMSVKQKPRLGTSGISHRRLNSNQLRFVDGVTSRFASFATSPGAPVPTWSAGAFASLVSNWRPIEWNRLERRLLICWMQSPHTCKSAIPRPSPLAGAFCALRLSFWRVRLSSGPEGPRRLVTLRRDGDDFVVLFYPEDTVVFRHTDLHALRKMCAFLRWKIISDSSSSEDTTTTS